MEQLLFVGHVSWRAHTACSICHALTLQATASAHLCIEENKVSHADQTLSVYAGRQIVALAWQWHVATVP